MTELNKSLAKNKVVIFSLIGAVAIAASSVAVFVALNSNADKNETPVVTVDDLTDEQQKKLGVDTKKKESTKTTETENKNSYTEEYKEYLKTSDEEKKKTEVIPREQKVPDKKIEEIKEDLAKTTDEKVEIALPSKFDLRDVIDITVGNQGKYGVCWSYATSTSLETHLKLRGIDYNPSEFQIDFLASNLMYGKRDLHSGANFRDYVDMVTSIGSISENKFTSLNIDLDGTYGSGSNNFDYYKLAKNDNPIFVTKTVDFPAVYKENGIATNKTDEELTEFRNLVKKHIMTNGSLYTVIPSPWIFGLPRYCEKYVSGECEMDHAVSIIGWDDTYSKENFGKVNEKGNRVEGTPVHDGAYIALNSYGEDWSGSGSQKGVYYISYDEYSVESQLSGIVSTSLDDTINIESISSQAVKDLIKEKFSVDIIEKNGNKYISDYVIDKVTSLELSSRNLTNQDLSDIVDIFYNLQNLSVSDNNISDISSVKKLKYLDSFNFSENNVSDISALCGMGPFYSLDLSYNHISDISCLEGKMNDYSVINVSGNMGITGFEKITTLGSLNADEIGLQSLESLKNHKNLSMITARNNDIKSLDGLNTDTGSFYAVDLSGNKGLTNLASNMPIYFLSINDTNLTDITILNSANAVNVFAARNDFKDLSGFKNEKISQLDLSENKNLTNLSALNTLGTLKLSDCGISSLSRVSSLNKIEYLDLSKNAISSLDGIKNLESLLSLTIDNNYLSSLNGVSELPNINSISADNNMISDADELLDMEKLYFVSLNNNRLTKVPNFTKQQDMHLALGENPIKDAVIPKAVNTINLKDCGVKTIDFSAAKRLTNANLEGNPDWNDYSNLISTSILGQRNLGFPYISITVNTDYGFSRNELNNLGSIQGLHNSEYWAIYMPEYHYSFKKTQNDTINLEDYPYERQIVMSLLSSNISINGATVDKAATKMVFDNGFVSPLLFNYNSSINSNERIRTDKIVFDIK